jgi:hypothetical protein
MSACRRLQETKRMQDRLEQSGRVQDDLDMEQTVKLHR